MLDLRSAAFLELGQTNAALAAAEIIVSEQPQYGRGYVARGRARLVLNDLDGAESDLKKAAALDPGPWVQQNLARLQQKRSAPTAP